MDKQEAIYKFRELFYSIVSDNKYLNNEIYVEKELRRHKVNNTSCVNINNDRELYIMNMKSLNFKVNEFEKLMEMLDL